MESALQCIAARLTEYSPSCCIHHPDCCELRQFEVWHCVPEEEGEQGEQGEQEPLRAPREETLYHTDPHNPRQDTLYHKGSQEDTPCYTAPQEDAPCYTAPREDAPCYTAPREDVLCYMVPREDTLYYIEESALSAADPARLPRNLICCGTTAVCPDACNLIRLGLPAPWQVLAPVIGQTLAQLAQYDLMMRELLPIMDQEDALSAMVDCYSRRMNIHASIVDTSFKRLAVTSTNAVSFSESTERCLQEQVLSDATLTILENYALHLGLPVNSPYCLTHYEDMPKSFPFPDRFASALHLPIRSGGSTVAIMAVVSFERKLDPVDIAIGQDIARLLSLILIRDGLVQNHPFGNYSAMLHEVITSALIDDDAIRLRLKALNWSVPDDLYVAVLQPQMLQEANPLARIQKLQHEFTEIVPGAISDVYQDHAYFLIGRSPGEDAVSGSRKRLKLFLQANRASLGISSVFHAPSRLRSHFLQAQSAAVVGAAMDPGSMIYAYEDYTAELSVSALSRSANVDLDAFCHPVIRHLSDSRRPADHDLLNTLEQYLFSMKDVTKTCEALHIHRSTLFYRLNKLKDLLGEDALSNGRIVQQLMYSFTVLHYRERAGRS